MLTKDDLRAIENILDRKLDEKLEEKLEKKLEEKLDEKLEEKLEVKLDQKLKRFKPEMSEMMNRKFDLFKLEMSEMTDRKLDPLKKEIHMIRTDLLENNVIPRLNAIENCYLSTYNRYAVNADRIEAMSDDISVIKAVVSSHAEQLKKCPCKAG